MNKCFILTLLVALSFCLTGKGYCGLFDTLIEAATQTATQAPSDLANNSEESNTTDKTPSEAANKSTNNVPDIELPSGNALGGGACVQSGGTKN